MSMMKIDKSKVVKREYMRGKRLYTLKDYAWDPLKGRFYREELQPVTVTGDEVYKIEKGAMKKYNNIHELCLWLLMNINKYFINILNISRILLLKLKLQSHFIKSPRHDRIYELCLWMLKNLIV